MRGFVLLVAATLLVAVASAQQRGQPITSLPGYTGRTLPKMSSGYLTVNAGLGKALFYWLVESSKSNAPLIFWFQGGPGCSGLYGLLTEHGPFRPNMQGGIDPNPVSWHSFANVVYLEQPAGVGFSYSNNSAGYNTGDVQAAIDNYVFVQAFLVAYPEFVGRTTYLAGESYGGVYVPTLAHKILSNPGTQIYKQLTGISVANGVFSCGSGSNNTIQIDLFYWHGLVSYENYHAYNTNNCNLNSGSGFCQNLVNTIFAEVGVIDQELAHAYELPSLDPDNLYQNFCTGNASLHYVETVGSPSCNPIGSREQTYLRRSDVQAAIHAAESLAPAPWAACSGAINYDAVGAPMVPLYQQFQSLKPGFQVLVSSGDVDIATVPFAVTLPCLHQIGSPNTRTWGPWFVNGGTAGYWAQYKHYTFATVKGAGHEAPQYVPLSSYYVIKRFIEQGNLHDLTPRPARKAVKRPLTQGQVLRKLLQERIRRGLPV